MACAVPLDIERCVQYIIPARYVHYWADAMIDANANPEIKRGRPRQASVRDAVLAGAGQLLLQAGIKGFSIEGVARLSGASKGTIYKWWPSKGALALDGFYTLVSPTIDTTLTGNVEQDLVTQVNAVLALFRDTAIGPILAGLISEAQRDPELAAAIRERWLEPRRLCGVAILETGKATGHLRPDFDPTTVLDQVYGPIYLRLLIGHAPLTDDLAAMLVRTILSGILVSPRMVLSDTCDRAAATHQ
jgi:AcrR family transcriptional regulator